MCTRLWVLALALLLCGACDRSSAKPPTNAGDGAGQNSAAVTAGTSGTAGAADPTATTGTPAATATSSTPLPPDQGKQGTPCVEGRCATGLKCIEFYGIAGPRGPKFTSCEIPCPTDKCPRGQTCVTISDGPGRVCQPSPPSQ